jgi:hypothetical protein
MQAKSHQIAAQIDTSPINAGIAAGSANTAEEIASKGLIFDYMPWSRKGG